MSASRPEPGADILIVDDTAANLRLLSQTLTEAGYQVRAATSGARGLESALAVPPNLVMLDIRMPGMDGFEVCRKLKESDVTRDVPVIFISAVNELEEKVQALRAGGVDYITKPFQSEEVLARVETHLSLRRLQQSLEATNHRLARELTLAGKVQASFLPRALPKRPGWTFAAYLRPARETSGDFYDVMSLPDGRVGLLIADVVDKGVPAALLMAMSWSLICSYIDQNPESPGQTFSFVNSSLHSHLGGGQFVTAFLGMLDTKAGQITCTNAGQMPPFLLVSQTRELVEIPTAGLPLGVEREGKWPPTKFQMAVGDSIVLYTDGLTDAQDSKGRAYGRGRLRKSAAACLGQSADEIVGRILTDVDGFVGDEPQVDDMALVVASRVA